MRGMVWRGCFKFEIVTVAEMRQAASIWGGVGDGSNRLKQALQAYIFLYEVEAVRWRR